jgi:hypothetical protein
VAATKKKRKAVDATPQAAPVAEKQELLEVGATKKKRKRSSGKGATESAETKGEEKPAAVAAAPMEAGGEGGEKVSKAKRRRMRNQKKQNEELSEIWKQKD